MWPASRLSVRPISVAGSMAKWPSCSATSPSTSVAVEVERRGLSSLANLRLESEGVGIGRNLRFAICDFAQFQIATELLTRCRDFRNLWKKHGPSPWIPTAIELRKRRPLGALACLKFRFGLCASP